jgi:acetyltransferase-like isoleucine patch superfamily enzyme
MADPLRNSQKTLPGTSSKSAEIDNLQIPTQSVLSKYREFFVGQQSWGAFLQYEIFVSLFGLFPGGAGFYLRNKAYPRLFSSVGHGVQWGSNITIRHPYKICIGDNTAIDNDCMLCARGSDTDGFRIANDVIISRGSFIQSKAGNIDIGAYCSIGVQCYIGAANDIKIGNHVLIGGQCYIGGGRYPIDKPDTPMKEQGSYSNGPIEIGDDVWIGAGVTILDSIKVGKGAVLGAGAVITQNVKPYAIVGGVPAKEIGDRIRK